MNKSNRKTINKETQEAIKKLLTSNVPLKSESPITPTIGLDPNFSRILQRKREEQLEASRQKLFDSTISKCDTLVEANETEKKSETMRSMPIKKDVNFDLENSMMFGNANKSWNGLSDGEDSFLALERQCNMEDKHECLINANDTLLFDVEPPSEMFDQTINQTMAVYNLSKIHEDDESESVYADKTIENCPVKPTNRPETIIEETSSQFESSSESSASAKISLCEAASLNDTVKELPAKSCNVSKNSVSSHNESQNSALGTNNELPSYIESKKSQTMPLQPNSQTIKIDRQRRGTFAFKRANYTFFPTENIETIINENASTSKDAITETPTKDLLPNIETNPKSDNNENDEDQFNNTLERVDYLLEKGKQILEETPVAKRSRHHTSLLETPLFSCKRKRLLTEMAAEMLPLPKRGPLIDFSTPEISKQRSSKFTEK